MNDNNRNSADDDGRRRRARIALLFGIPLLLAELYMVGTVDIVPLRIFRTCAEWADVPFKAAVYALAQVFSFLIYFLSVLFVVLLMFISVHKKTGSRDLHDGVMVGSILGILVGHVVLSPPPVQEWCMINELRRAQQPISFQPVPASQDAPQPPPPPPAANGAGV